METGENINSTPASDLESSKSGGGRRARNDIILIVFILLFAIAACLVFFLTGRAGSVAVVLIDGEEYARYPLGQRTEAVIRTADEENQINVLVIDGGKAYIKEASCPDKICVHHRQIYKSGETIVCLPHRLVIEIE